MSHMCPKVPIAYIIIFIYIQLLPAWSRSVKVKLVTVGIENSNIQDPASKII